MLALTLLLACHDARPTAPPPPEATEAPTPAVRRAVPRVEARATVVAVGDIMMHGMVKKTAADHADAAGNEGFDVLWTDLVPVLRTADLAFGNLETPIAPDHHRGVRQMVFNAPPAVLDSLHDAGFDVVSFANNHVYDQGRGGLEETIERIDAHALTQVGAGASCAEAWAPRHVDVAGIPMAFVGSTDLYNDALNAADDAACVATFEVAPALASVAAARAEGAELVVVSVHWGVEYATQPLAEHVKAAHALIDGGADVVLGHHPHVLQPLEVHEAPDGRRGLVAYSLGNFVSNQSAWWRFGLHGADAGNPRDGVVLAFDVVRKDYGRGAGGEPLLRTELADIRAIPTFTRNNTHRRRGDERVHIAVESMASRWDAACAAWADGDDATRVAALREAEMMGQRWNQARSILGEAFVPARPEGCPDPTATE